MERKLPDPIWLFLIVVVLMSVGVWILSLDEPKTVKNNDTSIEKPEAIKKPEAVETKRKPSVPKNKKKSGCSFVDPSSLCGPLNPANPLNPNSDPFGLWD